MLNEIRDFAACLYTIGPILFEPPVGTAQVPPTQDRFRMYCPKCGDLRRIKIEPVFWACGQFRPSSDPKLQYWFWQVGARGEIVGADNLGPVEHSIFKLSCTNCDARFTAVVYPLAGGLHGVGLVVLPFEPAGIRTPNTPEGVAYYLDQAARCVSVDAASAAAAMFRSAVEQFLQHQGFTKRMLGPKIAELETAIESGNAPAWVDRMDPTLLGDTLNALKDLANAAVHAGTGDVSNQHVIDAELLSAVQIAIAALLDAAYEAPKRAADQAAALRAAAAKIKGTPDEPTPSTSPPPNGAT